MSPATAEQGRFTVAAIVAAEDSYGRTWCKGRTRPATKKRDSDQPKGVLSARAFTTCVCDNGSCTEASFGKATASGAHVIGTPACM